MPLHYIQSVDPTGVFAIWQNDESNAYFEKRLQLNDGENELLNTFSKRKRLEWLSSRYLLHIMTGAKSRTSCVKDEYGKPMLVNSNYHISLSHSADRTAVIASKLPVGIDIQKIVSKIGRISRKFCNSEELRAEPSDTDEQLLFYHIIWGAKECIYKSYGKRKVDFRKHMIITEIENNLESGTAKGAINMDTYKATYHIEYHILDSYVIVTSIENGKG